MKKHYILLFMLAAALYGCIESAPVADDVKSSAPGFGSSQQRPEGTKLDFPAGIGMSGKPHRSPHYADEAIARKQIYGSGPLHFCLRLSNATGESVTVTLPAGTIFVSEDEQLPNALLIKEIRIKVPEASTMSCYLMAYSVNQNRTSASSPVFEPQAIVTSHYALPELMSFLAAKKVDAADFGNEFPPSEISDMVQEAVHEIAHTGKWSVNSRKKLAKLPEN